MLNAAKTIGERLSSVLIACFCTLTLGSMLLAQQQVPEYQLKAAFLYNFAKFTEWPKEAFKDSNAPLVVGVLGEDPFGEAIDLIRDKKVKNRKIEVKRFKRVDDIDICHILFVSSSEKDELPKIAQTLKNVRILTVGDSESFIESGGVIQFVLNDNKLGFEVNAEAVRQAEFTISSQLLKFATLVRTGSDSGDN